MFRGDGYRSGWSDFVGPSQRPAVLWRFATGARISGSVAIGRNGALFFGSHDGWVYALGHDGRLAWRFRTNDAIWGSPALADGGRLVVIGSDDDHLYGLDANTGTLRFKVKLGSCRPTVRIGKETVLCDVDSSPMVDGRGHIFVGSDGLWALDTKGTILWHFGSGHVASSPMVGPDGTVVFGSQNNQIVAVRAPGLVSWRHVAHDDVDSTVALGPGGTVYVGSDDGRFYALDRRGRLRWALRTEGPVRSSAAVSVDLVTVGSDDGRLYALDPASGRIRWVFATGGRVVSSPTIDAQGRIYVGSQDGRVYCLNKEGRLLWSLSLGRDVDSGPVIGRDGRLYVGCDDGRLYALGHADGRSHPGRRRRVRSGTAASMKP
ncbi:MAG: PQQ-binding-like beta-propeller repeat protein [Deltaproteobacteria bacterium]|nr:PQQ-binding-like beta-propeller repeat protein [Deltaproteobacteria bacterium]